MGSKELIVEHLNDRDIMITDLDIHMYLFLGDKRAMLVDTGFGTHNLSGLIKGFTSLPIVVVISHGHDDHAAGTAQFSAAYAHPAEHGLIKAYVPSGYELKAINEGETIDLGGRVFEVVHIPGHRPGGIALLNRAERFIVTGDNVSTTPVVMYMEDADPKTLMESNEKLYAMRDTYDRIYPAHGTVPITAEQITKVNSCLKAYISDELEGTGTAATGPEGTPCTQYSKDGGAIYV